jgi:hypothetical protein
MVRTADAIPNMSKDMRLIATNISTKVKPPDRLAFLLKQDEHVKADKLLMAPPPQPKNVERVARC